MTSTSQIDPQIRDIFDWVIMKVYRPIIGAKYIVEDFRGPFVQYIFEEYNNAKRKMLFVVHNTNSLLPLQDAAEKRLLFDQLTLIAEILTSTGQFIGNPQWDFALKLNSTLNHNDYKEIAWTNLFKVLTFESFRAIR